MAATTVVAADTAGANAPRVLVAGATGLVGREVLAALLADKAGPNVLTVGRRMLPLQHPRLQQQVVDFASLPALPPLDAAYIALGTTIKVAGSQEAFRAIDHDAVLAVARAARAAGARHLAVVSAMGADPASSIFYSRVKGEVEVALRGMGFDSLVIVRPSMLAGNRAALDQPQRAGERAALVVTRLLRPLIPANYRSVQAIDVAHAMLRALRTGKPGVQVLLSGVLQGAHRA